MRMSPYSNGSESQSSQEKFGVQAQPLRSAISLGKFSTEKVLSREHGLGCRNMQRARGQPPDHQNPILKTCTLYDVPYFSCGDSEWGG